MEHRNNEHLMLLKVTKDARILWRNVLFWNTFFYRFSSSLVTFRNMRYLILRYAMDHGISVILESSHCESFGICEYGICTRVEMCDLAIIQIMTKKVTKG